MEIYRVRLTKEKLAAMPPAERALLLLLGHANNEINTLSKLILMTRKDDPPIKLMNHVESGQVTIIMRILIGKLHEAWELFKGRVQGNRSLAGKYLPKLPAEGKSALEELNSHFGKGSPLTQIRNKIAFHYNDKDELVEANFPGISETESWEFYLSKTIGNSFYYASELVMTLSALNLVKIETDRNALDEISPHLHAFSQLCGIVSLVSDQITELFGHLMAEIVTDHIPDCEVLTEQIPDGPKLSSFCLPYFFDEKDTWTNAPSAHSQLTSAKDSG